MSAAILANERGNSTRRPRARTKAIAALLADIPLFAGLSDRHLRRIAAVAEDRRYAAGRPIVQQGGRGDAFFVIAEGEAKVTMGGSTRAVARLGPGDFFGELAILDGGPRTASVIAATNVLTLRIMRSDLRGILREEPDVALKLLEEVAGRLRDRRSPTH
jgi:CRP/FNR family transcriptional regulator